MWTRGLLVGAALAACTGTSQPVAPGPDFARAPASGLDGPSGPERPERLERLERPGGPILTVTPRVRSELASWPGALAWSPDGARVIVGDDSGAAWSVEASQGAPVRELGRLAHRVTAIAATNTHIAVAASTSLRVWGPNDAKGRELSGHEDMILDLGFVGEALLAVDLRDVLRRWDLESDVAVTTTVPTLHAISLALAPDGRALAIGGHGEVTLIEVPGGGQRFTLAMPRCSEAPTDLLCAEWRSVRIEEFALERGGHPSTYWTDSPNWQVSDLAFSADGTRLALGRADGVAVVVDAVQGRALGRFAAGVDKRAVVALTRDGGTLAIGDADGRIGLWEVASGRELRVVHEPGEVVGSLAFSPDDSALAAGGPGRRVTIWTLGR
jgi:WD40 repeat protein